MDRLWPVWDEEKTSNVFSPVSVLPLKERFCLLWCIDADRFQGITLSKRNDSFDPINTGKKTKRTPWNQTPSKLHSFALVCAFLSTGSIFVALRSDPSAEMF